MIKPKPVEYVLQGQFGHRLKLTIFILKECVPLDMCGWELLEVCPSGTARKLAF